jgi:hypothetical protein
MGEGAEGKGEEVAVPGGSLEQAGEILQHLAHLRAGEEEQTGFILEVDQSGGGARGRSIRGYKCPPLPECNENDPA